MSSQLVTRNIRIHSRRTSVRLEPALWSALESIAEREQVTINMICSRIEDTRGPKGGFTSALRVFIVEYLANGRAPCALKGPDLAEAGADARRAAG